MVKRYNPEDPFELRGTGIPEGDTEYQARSIIEEFLWSGMSEAEVLKLFEDPFYSGTFLLTQRLGRKTILRILKESRDAVPSFKVRVDQAP